QRASNLIKSLKIVSVDQSSDEIRKVELKKYLEEIISSLSPKIKETNHTVSIVCDEKVTIHSYPGALAQIITNFLLNSFMHAYDTEDSGNIVIEAKEDGENIALFYRDDGMGIPLELQDRVFDPFLTTKRDSGGTGLGLHIVFNIVTNTLKGSIRLVNKPDKGTTFKVVFPKKIS
ncbi:MAG: HAMP domain-containing histidine kinase, partial [Nitrospinae bacterium]|nr:HAMP domain-containing histidine kinase [Nitrospinota bacterium]